MANVYVGARPKGRAEGEPTEDYVVEDHAGSTISTLARKSCSYDT